MDWMLMPLRRYADFQGRSRRKEYWMFYLFYLACIIVPYILMLVLGGGKPGGSALAIIPALILLVVALGFFIPTLAVSVRRLHDQDKSGWFLLLAFVPLVSLVLLVFFCLDGTKGPNKYGPDPKADVVSAFS